MSRCENGTYTERDRDRSFFKLGPTCPPPPPSTGVRPFSPQGSRVHQLRNSCKTCSGLGEGQKTPPRGPALSARREGSHGPPKFSAKTGMGLR